MAARIAGVSVNRARPSGIDSKRPASESNLSLASLVDIESATVAASSSAMPARAVSCTPVTSADIEKAAARSRRY